MHPIETLLGAKYDINFIPLNKLKITIKHRTKNSQTKEILGSEIEDITTGHITLKDDTFIPRHRIIKVEEINPQKQAS